MRTTAAWKTAPRTLFALGALGIVVLSSTAAILATYSRLSHTWDEGTHVVAGLEFLQDGRYTFQTENPDDKNYEGPVGRVTERPLSDPTRDVRRNTAVAASPATHSCVWISVRFGVLRFARVFSMAPVCFPSVSLCSRAICLFVSHLSVNAVITPKAANRDDTL